MKRISILTVRSVLVVIVSSFFVVLVWAATAFSQDAGNVFLPLVTHGAQEQQEPVDDRQAAIDLLLTESKIAAFLETKPGWHADAYQDDDTSSVWHIDFYTSADEWTGYGIVDLDTRAILESFVPRELNPDEFQKGLAAVEFLLAHDPEVQARLEVPELWDHETNYDVWEQAWFAWYSYGLDRWAVRLYVNEAGEAYLDDIYDPNVLADADRIENERNQAIELAYSAESIDQALAGVDNWRTYVEHQGDARYSVEFVNGEEALFYALVDIATGEILETQP